MGKLKLTPKVLNNKRKVRHRWKRYHKTRFSKISRTGWRKPKGIDNPMKRQFIGRGKMVKIGFGSDKRLRYRNRNTGRIRFRIRNIRELEPLMMHTNKYEAVIARNVGAKKRKEIVLKAAELGIKVVNRTARLVVTERE